MPFPLFFDVLLHNIPIGTITYIGNDRTIFSFKESYLLDQNRATLSLGFKDQSGKIISDFSPTQTRLLPFFSNLLPEGHLRQYLADRLGVKSMREFFLLWILGEDLPGAITILPQGDISLIKDTHEQTSSITDSKETFRFSLAGVQLKFSAVINTTGGLTIPASGVGGSWIIKLPAFQFSHVPENEFSMMTLAKKMGMDIPDIKLIDLRSIHNLPEELISKEEKALAIKRFDRTEMGTAIHIEDFAQVFSIYPEDKYGKASFKNILQVLINETTEVDIAEFIRRLVFNTLIGNADMHLKNWSLIYSDQKKPRLAPAYDFISTIPFIADNNAALNFSRTKRFDKFTVDELKHLAIKAGASEPLIIQTALETVARFYDHWEKEKHHLLLSKETIEMIERHLKTIPLAY
ncbi:MAG: type II toxin-antitoxin system HipA family toxin [Alphaproteobacteria bacterium]|nr:type II toxin-antitoxin system HipA family toxin [Alphaproteobacteria bacterium]